jgi:DNA-binding MarR family transcriptional regulator
VLTREQLVELTGARHWARGRFSLALAAAIDRRLIRDVGLGFYAPMPVGAGDWEPVDPGARMSQHEMPLDQSDYEHLLELRTGLRRFLRWSEEQAKSAGLTAAQHQLLLAIKGHPDAAGPTISEIADYLVLRHHSAVGLIDRAAAEGLVTRTPDPQNKSAVRVTLTAAGSQKLDELTEAHLAELSHLAPTMRTLWKALARADGDAPHPAARKPARGSV